MTSYGVDMIIIYIYNHSIYAQCTA